MAFASPSVRIDFSLRLDYAVAPPGADFVFHVQAAHTRHQTVLREHLQVSPALRLMTEVDPGSGNRSLRLRAGPGPLRLSYQVELAVHHHSALPETLQEVPVADLPGAVLAYVYPSRYCQSDQLAAVALAAFGHLPPGHARVMAIQAWVRQRVRFQQGATTSVPSARDTLAQGVGVCRDCAHLMIALCRALNLPARFTTGIDYGADPALGPPDFHAYVEVYLSQRWYLFDPSGTAIPMGFVRLATGRDAADVSFATLFGPVQSGPPDIRVSALTEPGGPWRMPQPTDLALSTDAGP